MTSSAATSDQSPGIPVMLWLEISAEIEGMKW